MMRRIFQNINPLLLIIIITGYFSGVMMYDLYLSYGYVARQQWFMTMLAGSGTFGFFLLSVFLGVWSSVRPEKVTSFIPVYTVGFAVFFAVIIVFSLYTGAYLTVLLLLFPSLVFFPSVAFSIDISFASVSDRKFHPTDLWTVLVITGNFVSFVLLVLMYFETIASTHIVPILLLFIFTTILYPYAIFEDAYSHTAYRGLTKEFPIGIGCLGLSVLSSVGFLTVIVTPTYLLYRSVSVSRHLVETRIFS